MQEPSSDVAAVRRAAVVAAATRIRPHLRTSPLHRVDRAWLLDSSTTTVREGAEVVLKLDLLLPTGSFKVRGATSLLTAASVPSSGGVVAASGGNFGAAVAWAAARLGHHATVFVPSSSPGEKIATIRGLGADVRVVDGWYAEAATAAHRHVADHGGLSAHAYDDPHVVAGQGTATLELLDAAAVDTVLVACGGGGLVAGAIAAAAGACRVVAVETRGTATLATALQAGRPVDVEVGGIAASSLGARRIGGHLWEVRDQLADHLVVEDDEVAAAQVRLWTAARLVAEPGGATALAALTSGRYVPAPDERVAVLVCGANVDPTTVVGGP